MPVKMQSRLELMVKNHEAQKYKVCTPNNENVITTVHDRTVLQFFASYFKFAWENVSLTKGFNLHKAFVLVVSSTWSFWPVCSIACWSMWHCPHTKWAFLKFKSCFHFFFLCHCNPFESHTPGNLWSGMITRLALLKRFEFNVHLQYKLFFY